MFLYKCGYAYKFRPTQNKVHFSSVIVSATIWHDGYLPYPKVLLPLSNKSTSKYLDIYNSIFDRTKAMAYALQHSTNVTNNSFLHKKTTWKEINPAWKYFQNASRKSNQIHILLWEIVCMQMRSHFMVCQYYFALNEIVCTQLVLLIWHLFLLFRYLFKALCLCCPLFL